MFCGSSSITVPLAGLQCVIVVFPGYTIFLHADNIYPGIGSFSQFGKELFIYEQYVLHVV